MQGAKMDHHRLRMRYINIKLDVRDEEMLYKYLALVYFSSKRPPQHATTMFDQKDYVCLTCHRVSLQHYLGIDRKIRF
jgi:hypothetical protein